jgi:hypothetical protein
MFVGRAPCALISALPNGCPKRKPATLGGSRALKILTCPVSTTSQPKEARHADATQNKSDGQGRSRSEKSAKLKGELIDIQLVVLHDPDFEASALAIILAIAIPMKDSGQCSYQSFDAGAIGTLTDLNSKSPRIYPRAHESPHFQMVP